MDEQDLQAIDDEMLDSALRTHRLEYPVVRETGTLGTRAPMTLLNSPYGRLSDRPGPDEMSDEGGKA